MMEVWLIGKGYYMTPEQITQMLNQLGLSAVFLVMLWKLWNRHMQMTDKIIGILLDELKAERSRTGIEVEES